MKRAQIDRLGCCPSAPVEGIARMLQKLPPPLRNPVGMQFEPLDQLCQGLVPTPRSNSHLGPECRRVRATGASR